MNSETMSSWLGLQYQESVSSVKQALNPPRKWLVTSVTFESMGIP